MCEGTKWRKILVLQNSRFTLLLKGKESSTLSTPNIKPRHDVLTLYISLKPFGLSLKPLKWYHDAAYVKGEKMRKRLVLQNSRLALLLKGK